MNNTTTRVNMEALRQLLGNMTTGHWIYTEEPEQLPGGGELTRRGFKCSECGFFRHKRQGGSKFCEDCGARMQEVTK